MQKYKELNLKKLRTEAGLDFAHFTFLRGQCSCCYSPLDMPDRYWAKGRRPQMVDIKRDTKGNILSWNYDRPLKDVQYILFKNAANVNGVVTRNDVICEWPARDRENPHYSPRYSIAIIWNFPMEKMDLVLKGLRTQLDADYEVLRPAGKNRCIEIVCAKDLATSDLPRVFRV
jgi:hypothetical protein